MYNKVLVLSLCFCSIIKCMSKEFECLGTNLTRHQHATCEIFRHWCSSYFLSSSSSLFSLEFRAYVLRQSHESQLEASEFGLSGPEYCQLLQTSCCHQPDAALQTLLDPRTPSLCRLCIDRKLCGSDRCLWSPKELKCVSLAQADEGSIGTTDECDLEDQYDELKHISLTGGYANSSLADLQWNKTIDIFATARKTLGFKAEAYHLRAGIEIATNNKGFWQKLRSFGTAAIDLDVSAAVAAEAPVYDVVVDIASPSRMFKRSYYFRVHPLSVHASPPPIESSSDDLDTRPKAHSPQTHASGLSAGLLTVVAVAVTLALVAVIYHWQRAAVELGLPGHRSLREVDQELHGHRGSAPDSSRLTLLSSEWMIDSNRVKIGRELGIGASAQVFEGSYCGEIVAVKRFYSSEVIMDQFKAYFDTEATILTQLHHPNVVRFFGAVCGRNRLYLITEYCSQNLAQRVQMSSQIPNWMTEWFPKYAMTIANGMAFLHSKNIIHCDLKPENILLTPEQDGGVVKICDFGMSRVVVQDQILLSTNGVFGTPAFLAPEVATESHNYASFPVDVYAYGMLLYYLWTRRFPYSDQTNINPFILLERVKRGFRPGIPSDMAPEIQQIMSSCWSSDPGQRPSFDYISCRMQQLFPKSQTQRSLSITSL